MTTPDNTCSDQNGDRAEQVDRVIEDVIRRRNEGETLADQQIVDEHEELMPELAGELSKLRQIERAMAVADAPDDDSNAQDELAVIPDAPASVSPLGLQIEGYEILRELSRGGQAAIYVATQQSTGRKVAIKVLYGGPFASAGDRARFEREVQILAELEHPNIVSIIDRGLTQQGFFYLVMRYIRGEPLDVWLDRWRRDHPPPEIPSDPSALLRLFVKTCQAVDAAHRRQILHRDLKPSNIRIDAEGEPHILDFGLARASAIPMTDEGEASPLTITGQFLGSLPWASPEQTEGIPSKLDLRSDVYSLGVILYQMLTRQFPYDVTGSVPDVMDNVRHIDPRPPSQVIEARLARKATRWRRWRTKHDNPINPTIEAITLKALAKKPEDRYQNAGELAMDVANYLSGQPTIAANGLKRRGQRKRVWWRLLQVSLGTMLLAAIATVSVMMAHGPTGVKGQSTVPRLSGVERQSAVPRLLGHWRFEDGPGSTAATDCGGGGNDGSLQKMDLAAAWVTDTGPRGGQYSLRFDGIDDYVTIPHREIMNFGLAAFSLNLWFKSSAPVPAEAWYALWSKHNTGRGHDIEYWLGIGGPEDPGRLFACVGHRKDGYAQVLYSDANVLDGRWHMATLVRRKLSGTMRLELYLDGELQQSTPTSLDVDNGNPVTIGRSSYANGYGYFPGLIDEIALYSGALTAEAIAEQAVKPAPRGYANTVVQTISVGRAPAGIGIIPDGSRAYVANTDGNSVSVIRTTDNAVVDTIAVGRSPIGLAVSPDGSFVCVANDDSDSVSIIRVSDNRVTHTIPVADRPHTAAAVTPDGAFLYVGHYSSPVISRISVAQAVVTETITVGNLPRTAAVTPDGALLYVVNYGDSTVSIIRTADSTVSAVIPVPSKPAGLAISPDGSRVYVPCSRDRTVAVLRAADRRMIDSIPIPGNPVAAAVSPDARYVYVANGPDHTLSVIRTSSNTVVDTIPVGKEPFGVAVTPDNRYVYVTNHQDHTVSVIGSSTPLTLTTQPSAASN